MGIKDGHGVDGHMVHLGQGKTLHATTYGRHLDSCTVDDHGIQLGQAGYWLNHHILIHAVGIKMDVL